MTDLNRFKLDNLFSVAGQTVMITGGGSGIGRSLTTDFAVNGRGETGHSYKLCWYINSIQNPRTSSLRSRDCLPDVIIRGRRGLDQVSSSECQWTILHVCLGDPITSKMAEPQCGHDLVCCWAGASKVGNNTFTYGVSKAGTIHLSSMLAGRLHPLKIRVNCICPAHVDKYAAVDPRSTPPTPLPLIVRMIHCAVAAQSRDVPEYIRKSLTSSLHSLMTGPEMQKLANTRCLGSIQVLLLLTMCEDLNSPDAGDASENVWQNVGTAARMGTALALHRNIATSHYPTSS
ncbi:hypothetical protein I203_104724 [Kwoniella mangroviensis CBS 8507]|uniref:uncharacterized protein n=1 Tax=Kwoniella mangroviensis CBS 8507 TaxID=1296122 RepID=UPI00303ADFDB